MSEDLMPAFGPANTTFDRDLSSANPSAGSRRERHARPSALARQLGSARVQLLDKGAIQFALALTLFDTPLRQGQSLTNYLLARVSTRNLLVGTILLLVWRVLYWAMGLYQPDLNRRAAIALWKVPAIAFLCAILAYPLLKFAEPSSGNLRSVLLFWFFTCTLLLIVRAGVLTYEEHIRPAFRKPRTAVICGTGPLARIQARDLPGNRKFKYQLLGFVDNHPHKDIETLGPVLCAVRDLEQLLMHQPVDEVIIGLPLKSHFGDVEEIVAICGRAGVQMQYSLDLFSTEIASDPQCRSGDGASRPSRLPEGHHRPRSGHLGPPASLAGVCANRDRDQSVQSRAYFLRSEAFRSQQTPLWHVQVSIHGGRCGGSSGRTRTHE